jgi:type IV pilus assembly protein PilC
MKIDIINDGSGKIEKKEYSFNLINNFNDKKKLDFYKEFSILISSGVDFERTLSILVSLQKNRKDKEIIQNIRDEVIKGRPLYESMQKTEMFTQYEYFSIKIGEETKELEKVLNELVKYFDRKIKLKRQLISVFTYPAFVIIITFSVLFFMLHNVVPMFVSVFKQFGNDIPKLTKFIIYLSHIFPTILITSTLIFATLIAFHFYFKSNNWYRNIISNFVLKIPIFGILIKKIYLSRFSQSMSLLLNSKTSLILSLELTEKMINFFPIEVALKDTQMELIKGNTLSNSMNKHKIFDEKIIAMIMVGEQVNKLEIMFDKIHNQLDEEIEHQSKMIGVIIEPLIIIILGVIVGVVMIAMYAPMFDFSKIILKN